MGMAEEHPPSKRARKMQKFIVSDVENVIYSILRKHLKGKRYRDENIESWCHCIASEIKNTLIEEGLSQYKLACEVVIGENHGAALKVSSACFWDEEDDKQATEKYVTKDLCSMAVVFACRQYNV